MEPVARCQERRRSKVAYNLFMAATFEIPEPLFERLARMAERRGQTTEELVTEILAEGAAAEGPESGAGRFDAFIGSIESGDRDWAATDTAELRRQADLRRSA